MNEYKRYIGKPLYTEIQLSVMTDMELKLLYKFLRFQPIMVQIVKNFKDLRIKQLLREQIVLVEKVLKQREIIMAMTTVDRQSVKLSRKPVNV